MRIQNSPTPTLARSSPESLASSKAAEGPRERFESFSQDDQGEIRETLRQLNRKGRLYRQSENGGLRKIESLEAYRSLSIGGPGLYDAIAIDILTSSQSSKLDQELYRDHFSGFQTHQFEESDSQIKSAVQYQATPIESFAELLWTDLAPEGPKGCAYLSSQGFGVQVIDNNEDSTSRRRGQRTESNQLVYSRSSSTEESEWKLSR